MIDASPPPPRRKVLELRAKIESHYGAAAVRQPEHALGQYMFGEACRVNYVPNFTPAAVRKPQLERAARAYRAALEHWRDGVDTVELERRGREEVLCRLGLVLGELHGPATEEAMACYREAALLNSAYHLPRQYLGNELLEAGREAEASVHLQSCLALLGAEPVAGEPTTHTAARRQVQGALLQTFPPTA